MFAKLALKAAPRKKRGACGEQSCHSKQVRGVAVSSKTTIVFYAHLFLIAGCFGLAISLPPLIYITALGYLVAGFLGTPKRWLFLLLHTAAVLVAGPIFITANYLVRISYYGSPSAVAFAAMKSNWLQLIVSVLIVTGVARQLFAYSGWPDPTDQPDEPAVENPPDP